MSDKYKPNLNLDTVPVTSVKSDNEPTKKTTTSEEKVTTIMVFDGLISPLSNTKK